jgi:NADH dehydrogenase FAD-containing subunit
LYSADAGLLPGQSRLAARLALRALRRHGIAFLGGHRFLGCDGPGALRFGGAAGRQVRRADLAILATGARPPDWLTRAARREGIDVGEDGGIAVDACLRSPSDAQVWAAGDCASFVGMRVPRSGVHALRQGPVLAASLAAESGACAQPYRPSRHALALLNCCDGSAIAVRGPFAAAGQWAWRWKDRIDRGFIARFGAGASARGGL